ncbi:TIGR02285 family protein [Roseateles sp. YR242]|uniref:TIGR02285 family protein n=1 Tax=Roseateles sp. YR242 TaxID=1855305 RepID=UPI001160A315|nr:TIGR02285 family protein [Roseateles sp. YR242]
MENVVYIRRPASTPLRPLAQLLLVLATCMAPQADAAPEPERVDHITWLTSDNSTAINPNANGVTDRVVRYLSVWWPGVTHEIVVANAKRSWQMIESGQQVCRANMVRTPEREKVAYFINTQLTPPSQLVVRRDKLTRLPRTSSGEVLLPPLLADTSLRGALVDGRSYGTAVDEMIAKRPAGSSVTLYSPRDFGGRLLQMVSLDRADYSIEPDMALVMMGEPKDLVTVPIRGASDPVMAGIACPRTPWGLAAIRGIDRAFGRPEGAASLRQGLMHWLTPETQAHYAKEFDQFYRERSRPSKIVP